MIRWAIITAKTNDAVQLEVLKASSCHGCQLHCDKPLFDLFKLHKNEFWLQKNNDKIKITNPRLIFSSELPLTDKETRISTQANQAQNAERNVGQKVGLQFSEKHLLKSTFIAYILPLLLSLITMLMGHKVFAHFNWSVDFGALMGFLIGMFIFVCCARGNKYLRYLPEVTFL